MTAIEEVLEEIRPEPDPRFVAEMERQMALGFPPRRRRRLPRLALTGLRPRPVVAVAAGALLALLVTISVTGDEATDGDRPVASQLVEGAGGERAADDAAVEPGALALPQPLPPQPVPPPTGGQDIAPGADVRRIERSAQLTLAADPDGFDGLAGAIFRAADRRDGFVLRSSFTQGEDGFSGGSFELRVPAAELQPTLNELSRLATVRARSESGTDVTGSFVSIRDRLRTARAERTSLLRRLELATSDNAVRALRRRLEIVGSRIGGLREQFRGIRERTEYATILVELVDEDAGTASGETDEAIDDALGSLEDMLNFAIRAAGVLVPILFAGLVAWLVVARARRRARERALA